MGAMEDWQGRSAHVVNPSFVVSCTTSVPVNVPQQAVFCDHLKSIIETINHKNFLEIQL